MTHVTPIISSAAVAFYGAYAGLVGVRHRTFWKPAPRNNPNPSFDCRRVPATERTGWSGLSRMKGNFHVRFLEGGGLATARFHSARLGFSTDRAVLSSV